MEKQLPFVSIIIPCRNEENFIRKCLDSLLEQDYPKEKLEILVVVGVSTDRTKEILSSYAIKYPFVKVLDNPKSTTPISMNIGIKNARGELKTKTDAHSIYGRNYISSCVKYINEYQADAVGGVAKASPAKNNLVAEAIILSLSNRFGSGNSYFRIVPVKPVWVDTAFGICYKKEVFEKIGLYNEKLTRSQDLELNFRLKKAGGKILLAPDIIIHYYPKATISSFLKHNFIDGIWAIYPIKFGAPIFSIRHLAPLAFILVLVITAILGGFFKIFLWLFILELIIYFGTSLIISTKIAVKEKRYALVPFLMAGFFARHFGYGVGSLIGVFKLSTK